MITLGTLTIGQRFTFPEGTESAGIVHEVVEHNGERVRVAALGTLKSFNPTMTLAANEPVVVLD